MLSRLTIHNYALIQSLVLEPAENLNVITGETGAGKSIMLGALGLLLGNRADTKVLLDKSQKCIIEGEFHIQNYSLEKFFSANDLDYEEATIIRREIAASGKSRAFLNDTPVTLDLLKVLGKNLMDVHSQHETLLLGTRDYQLSVIDAYGQGIALLNTHQINFRDFVQKEKQYLALKETATSLAKTSDYNQFLLTELQEAQLILGEQEELEEEIKVLENAEDIKTKLTAVLALIDQPEYGTLNSLEQIKNSLSQLSQIGPTYQALDKRFEELYIELIEINRDISTQDSQVEVDPERTLQVQERISLFYSLQQKHQVISNQELLILQEHLESETISAENIDQELAELLNKSEAAKNIAQKSAQQLSDHRKKQFVPLKTSLEKTLFELGIPEAEIQFRRAEKMLSEEGIDTIDILFSANKGIPVAPLKQVASGGEFTRLMFSIKYHIADKTALPTIVFDEIDTGVSGEIALKLGIMMKKIAANHQVIAISHLPQIAAKGDAHYIVYKESGDERSISKIRALNDDDRVMELAKMIGGDSPTPSAFESAKELMIL